MTPEDAIRTMLAERRAGASICPSEAARLLDPANWRDHMSRIRSAAAGMVEAGEIIVTRKGQPVDIATARGPVRLTRP